MDEGGLVLATNALPTTSAAGINPPPNWNTKNWIHYQKLLKKDSQKPHINETAPNKNGKICFHCGWNKDHNSRYCIIMLNAPPGTFTDKQMSLVKFSPSRDPHIIDGKAINQTCASGVNGWP